MLLIIETHPVPYHAPVYRHLAKELSVPLKVIYGSDFSVKGYHDPEFNVRFAWKSDLLSDYPHEFLSTVAKGGGVNYDSVSDRGLWELAEKNNAKAVLVLGYFHPLDRSAIRYAIEKKLKIIFRGETSDQARARSTFKNLLRDTILRRFYRRCSSLLYLGEASRSHYLRLGCDEEDLIFSPYCVDDAAYQKDEESREQQRNSIRCELDIPSDSFVVLFSGKLSKRKGVDLVPEAVRLLPMELRQSVCWLILGDGELRGELETLCAQDPQVRVRFAGFRNQLELSPYYHAADMLVLPSRREETWGLVVNEAMAHGLPVVVTDNVGCRADLVVPGLTGAVCSAGDAGTLAQGIATCHSIGASVDDRVRIRTHVEGYSVARAAEGVAAAWRRAVSDKRS
jgi:glycosyltransferase involved in cell wall biosynthesis